MNREADTLGILNGLGMGQDGHRPHLETSHARDDGAPQGLRAWMPSVQSLCPCWGRKPG